MTPVIPARDRRSFLRVCSELGVGGTLLPGVLWAKLSAGAEITKATIAGAEEIAGVAFDDAERDLLVERLTTQAQQLDGLHKVPLDNGVAPALVFVPDLPARARTIDRKSVV